MNFTIDDPGLINWILIAAKAENKTENAFINAIINNYKLDFEAKNAKKPLITNIEDDIISLYKTLYIERFNIISNEIINKELTFNILEKALVWYFYVHSSEGPNGEKYPYLMRIFLEQEWLRRQCIESSQKYTIAVIKKVIAANKDPKDIIKHLKRGDYSGGFEDLNISQEWEETQTLAVKLFMAKKLPREAKENPFFKGLFVSEIPTIDYIRKARRLLEKVESMK